MIRTLASNGCDRVRDKQLSSLAARDYHRFVRIVLYDILYCTGTHLMKNEPQALARPGVCHLVYEMFPREVSYSFVPTFGVSSWSERFLERVGASSWPACTGSTAHFKGNVCKSPATSNSIESLAGCRNGLLRNRRFFTKRTTTTLHIVVLLFGEGSIGISIQQLCASEVFEYWWGGQN